MPKLLYAIPYYGGKSLRGRNAMIGYNAIRDCFAKEGVVLPKWRQLSESFQNEIVQRFMERHYRPHGKRD